MQDIQWSSKSDGLKFVKLQMVQKKKEKSQPGLKLMTSQNMMPPSTDGTATTPDDHVWIPIWACLMGLILFGWPIELVGSAQISQESCEEHAKTLYSNDDLSTC